MTEPSAQVICDSISPEGARLTTLEVVMHRFVLAEFNTHRVFSRNSASSRAIPVRRRIEQVRDDPALPVSWPRERRGMQGGAELDGVDRAVAQEFWQDAARQAVLYAEELVETGVHKSVVNRILEPFLWHTVVVTSTKWANFFAQRCSELAQPELRLAAEAMRTALDASRPTSCEYGDWHTPYVEAEDVPRARERWGDGASAQLRYVSVARCARVSYLTHDGRRDLAEDVKLYEKLVAASPPHASPLEHVATPEYPYAWSGGNFGGWRQLRHVVLGA